MDKIKSLSLPDYARVVVISDIHGEIDLLKSLLKKADYNREDYLIINGDLCEKGANSLAVVKYIMELSEENPKVYVLEGNCDTLVENLLEEDPWLLNYISKRKNTLLNDCLKHLGVNMDTIRNISELNEIIKENFSSEFNWLNDLPTAIETDDFIFVHAGLDSVQDWKMTSRENALRMPSFLDKAHQANKLVFVGHWPVINYPAEIPSHNPIMDFDKKIIAIDGGNVIKETGQLNALIINKMPLGNEYFYTYVDRFPKCEIIKDYKIKADPKMTGSISYPLFEISPIEEGEYFTLCRQQQTDKLTYIKNEYIKQHEDGGYKVRTDVSCAQLNVNKGDIVSILDNNCAAYTLIKKDGLVGWIPKEVLLETL
ncbi:metallophosphoesterase [Bacillus sp. E214]|uniref:metallophosphoesterase n=1 Tax=Bacillus sp. E214 TaxID=2587156 RepID=UPI0011DF5274|nr:metallophosphoesterase [Bacillus sp. E214]